MEFKEGDQQQRIPRLGPIYFTCGDWTPASDNFSPNNDDDNSIDILPTDSDSTNSDNGETTQADDQN